MARYLLVLALPLTLLALGRAEKKKEVDPTPALLKLADDVAKGGKNVKPLVNKVVELEPTVYKLMVPFRSRTLNRAPAKVPGLGIGAPNSFSPDGIEAMLFAFDRRTPTARQMKAQKDFVRAGEITVAIARVVSRMPPPENKNIRVWKKYQDQFNECSDGFLKAVKAGDPTVIQESAHKLNNVCVACHEDFR